MILSTEYALMLQLRNMIVPTETLVIPALAAEVVSETTKVREVVDGLETLDAF